MLLVVISLTGLWASGQSFYEQGKAEKDDLKKIDLFTKALDQKKDNWTYYRRGFAYYRLERYHEAIQDFDVALGVNGTLETTFIHSILAECYREIKKDKLALEHAHKSLEFDDENDSAWSTIGWVRIREGKYKEAIEALTKRVELTPNKYAGYADRSYAYLKDKQYEKVVQDANKVLELKPGHEKSEERKALALMKLGREEESLAIISKKIDYKPDDPASLEAVGDLFYSHGAYETAIEFYTKGIHVYEKRIAADPTYKVKHKASVYEIYLSRGDTYETMKKYQDALRDYKQAITIDPGNYRAYLDIGETQTFQKNYKEAIHAYEKAFAINPDLKTGWTNLGYCYSHIDDEHSAIKAYTRGIKADPQNGLLYSNRASAYMGIGDDDKGYQDLLKSIEVAPERVGAHVSLGVYYYNQGQYEEAVKTMTDALAMKKGSAVKVQEAYYTRGKAYEELEKYDDAIRDLEEAVRRDPQHVRAWEHLGRTHYSNGDNCEAYKALKEALRLDSHHKVKKARFAQKYLAKLTSNPCH